MAKDHPVQPWKFPEPYRETAIYCGVVKTIKQLLEDQKMTQQMANDYMKRFEVVMVNILLGDKAVCFPLLSIVSMAIVVPLQSNQAFHNLLPAL